MENNSFNEQKNTNLPDDALLAYLFTFRFANDSYDRSETIKNFNNCGIDSKFLPKISIGTNFKKSVKMNIGNDKFKTLHFISENKDFVTFQIDKVEHLETTEVVFDEKGSRDIVSTDAQRYMYDSKIVFDKELNKVLGNADNELVQKIYETIDNLCGQYSNLDLRSALIKYIKKETNAVQLIFGSDAWIIPKSDKDKLERIISLLYILDNKRSQYRLLDIMDTPTNKENIKNSVYEKFRTAMLETKDRIYSMLNEQKKMSITIYRNNMEKNNALKLFHESYKSILNDPLKECEKYMFAIEIFNKNYYNNSNINFFTDPFKAYKEIFNKLTPEQKLEFKTALYEKANFPKELLELIEN